ncbi:MAG: oxygen-dependent coproporphyrinogen oxidase [Gammaproteobacteria bacterium]|nr:oxygen-dependent coproporphyrinogen oxidase [Gammaproteobacteria bacterium]
MSGDAPDAGAVAGYLKDAQARICAQLQALESSAQFGADNWKHESGGGITRILEGGEVFEKGGVNFSHVGGDELPAAASAERAHLAGKPFEATGLSLVMHPRNPYVPCCHMNVRFFLADVKDNENEPGWWFGGGYDLTPCYGFDEDCAHWHNAAQNACAPFGDGHYAKFKAWCDRYFHLPHRGETRGVGGLFFDDYRDGGFARAFAFMQSVCDSFLGAYLPIVERRRGMNYGERERAFQLHRRSRYVEFNLLYDRGTLFGLQSGGRVESILMSLPPCARWDYDRRDAPGCAEAKLRERYLRPRDWARE